MDGLRKCLAEEFSHLYVFNLRGNARTQGEERRKEAGGIFGEGSRTPVAITIMVKDPFHKGSCDLQYSDIGDYLSRQEKLDFIEKCVNIDGVTWQRIRPNSDGDWANQRDPAFEKFIPLADKNSPKEMIFGMWSNGLLAARDAWVYNYSYVAISSNMKKMIENYNAEIDRYYKFVDGKPKDQWPNPEAFVDSDPKKISWSSSLLPNVARGRRCNFSPRSIVASMYRPYSKNWLYFDGLMNHRVAQWGDIFPTGAHGNTVISVSGVGASKLFSALVSDCIPNYHMHDTGQCFPLYWYEKAKEKDKAQPTQAAMFAEPTATPDEHGYVRHDAITDWALTEYRKRYADAKITKEDIFYYVYGILHSPEYKQRFAADLKKMLPRIPFAKHFHIFSKVGRELAALHLNYETIEPFPLVESTKRLVMEPGDYRVSKMVFGKKDGKPDKSVIVYNNHITLSGIPPEAYDYVVNGKPALEWIKERYEVTKDNDSGIENDPNAWSDDPRYIIDLIKRVTQVSIKSAALVASLPALNEFTSSKEIFRAERDVECVLK